MFVKLLAVNPFRQFRPLALLLVLVIHIITSPILSGGETVAVAVLLLWPAVIALGGYMISPVTLTRPLSGALILITVGLTVAIFLNDGHANWLRAAHTLATVTVIGSACRLQVSRCCYVAGLSLLIR